MNLICPFLTRYHAGSGHIEEYLCPGDCALWVESEKMCSFRLLADDIADSRERARDRKVAFSDTLKGKPLD